MEVLGNNVRYLPNFKDISVVSSATFRPLSLVGPLVVPLW